MKRRSLLVVATLTLLFTGVVLARAAASRRMAVAGAARSPSPFSGETAVRYRQSQPTHWRACLLQR